MCCVGNQQSAEASEDHAKKKTTRYQEQDAGQVAAYQEQIAGIPAENIAYVDETGIDTYLYRQHGYAPRNQKVYDTISGKRYARTGIVAAQLGSEILAACRYDGTMNAVLFEDWFENHLLPALPDGSVVVMDNASFHRKKKLRQLISAQKERHLRLIFLPPYSPEFNPIEHFWHWLKQLLRKIIPRLDSFDDALWAAFFFRDKLIGY